jgi:hypothetical protein
MKMKEAVKIIDEQWIRKPKGFRVHFQKRVDADLVTDHVPDMEDKPMDSDVVAWRLAWKLAQILEKAEDVKETGVFYNIYVVDDLGDPVDFYGTGRSQVFNPR